MQQLANSESNTIFTSFSNLIFCIVYMFMNIFTKNDNKNKHEFFQNKRYHYLFLFNFDLDLVVTPTTNGGGGKFSSFRFGRDAFIRLNRHTREK